MNPGPRPDTYRRTAVLTAPPPRVVQMLFDASVTHLECALDAFRIEEPAQRLETVHNHTMKSLDIVVELRRALDLEAGGEFGQRLHGLYTFVEERIREGNLRKQSAPLAHCRDILAGLRDAWREMLAKNSGAVGATAAQPAGQRLVLSA